MREHVVDRGREQFLPPLGPAGTRPTGERWQLEDAYPRATVQPAIQALHALGLDDEEELAGLRVDALAPDAAELRQAGGTLTVPPHLRRALARQRLHAVIVGQGPEHQLLTFDGSASTPSALHWY